MKGARATVVEKRSGTREQRLWVANRLQGAKRVAEALGRKSITRSKEVLVGRGVRPKGAESLGRKSITRSKEVLVGADNN